VARRDDGIELLLIASLYIWSEVRTARKLAAVSAAAATAALFVLFRVFRS